MVAASIRANFDKNAAICDVKGLLVRYLDGMLRAYIDPRGIGPRIRQFTPVGLHLRGYSRAQGGGPRHYPQSVHAIRHRRDVRCGYRGIESMQSALVPLEYNSMAASGWSTSTMLQAPTKRLASESRSPISMTRAQQFVGDALLAPRWILIRHPTDELLNLK
jgi:hypothetical protein